MCNRYKYEKATLDDYLTDFSELKIPLVFPNGVAPLLMGLSKMTLNLYERGTGRRHPPPSLLPTYRDTGDTATHRHIETARPVMSHFS